MIPLGSCAASVGVGFTSFPLPHADTAIHASSTDMLITLCFFLIDWLENDGDSCTFFVDVVQEGFYDLEFVTASQGGYKEFARSIFVDFVLNPFHQISVKYLSGAFQCHANVTIPPASQYSIKISTLERKFIRRR